VELHAAVHCKVEGRGCEGGKLYPSVWWLELHVVVHCKVRGIEVREGRGTSSGPVCGGQNCMQLYIAR
jgi:hypothetical protein